jgi:hypothetical protein
VLASTRRTQRDLCVAGWQRCDDDGIDLVEDVAKVRAAAHWRVGPHCTDEPPFVLVDHHRADVGRLRSTRTWLEPQHP